MELNIEGSKSNPRVFYNEIDNKLMIHGRSVLKNMDDKFYAPIIDFIINFSNSEKEGLIVEFLLDYFNTSSHPSLIEIFKKTNLVKGARILWLYEQNDMEMMEIGQELQMYSPIKFEINSKAVM